APLGQREHQWLGTARDVQDQGACGITHAVDSISAIPCGQAGFALSGSADSGAVMIAIEEFLIARGAAELRHPGGTLLAHLRRTHDTLAGWGARPALRLAGLAHATYGTDGFP